MDPTNISNGRIRAANDDLDEFGHGVDMKAVIEKLEQIEKCSNMEEEIAKLAEVSAKMKEKMAANVSSLAEVKKQIFEKKNEDRKLVGKNCNTFCWNIKANEWNFGFAFLLLIVFILLISLINYYNGKEDINRLKIELATMEKELKSIKLASTNSTVANSLLLKTNKWDVTDCGPNLAITQKGFGIMHSGANGWSCVRSVMPVPKFDWTAQKSYIASYFEVLILKRENSGGMSDDIGFCDQQFPMEGDWLGMRKDSIGIGGKGEMVIDESRKRYGNREDFAEGDVIGIGLINSPTNSSMECFATYNGQLLASFKLPEKFLGIQLFPAVTSYNRGNAIQTNFGKEEWRFNPHQLIPE